VHIIQTNISKIGDFQSMIYKIAEQTWDEFKDYILSTESFTDKIVYSTMGIATTKPKNIKEVEEIINDDFHLKVYFKRDINSCYVNYFKVENDNFDKFLKESK
jgi:hypothetical protein